MQFFPVLGIFKVNYLGNGSFKWDSDTGNGLSLSNNVALFQRQRQHVVIFIKHHHSTIESHKNATEEEGKEMLL